MSWQQQLIDAIENSASTLDFSFYTPANFLQTLTEHNENALHIACDCGDMKKFMAILEALETDENRIQALESVHAGGYAPIELLAEDYPYTLMQVLALFDDEGNRERLLKHEDNDGVTPLTLIMSHHDDLLLSVLDMLNDETCLNLLKATNCHGNTLFHLIFAEALSEERMQAMIVLLQTFSDYTSALVLCPNHEGVTPLQLLINSISEPDLTTLLIVITDLLGREEIDAFLAQECELDEENVEAFINIAEIVKIHFPVLVEEDFGLDQESLDQCIEHADLMLELLLTLCSDNKTILTKALNPHTQLGRVFWGKPHHSDSLFCKVDPQIMEYRQTIREMIDHLEWICSTQMTPC